MKTLQSDLHGTLERFRADSVDFKSEMARRENRPLIAMLGDAIDLVMHDHMCTFQQALQWLQPLAEVMPIPQTNWSTVQHYLCQHRKLHPNLIEQYHRQQLIEADSRNNAVFCMRNAHQQAIGAELVGIHPKYPFKGLTKGTPPANHSEDSGLPPIRPETPHSATRYCWSNPQSMHCRSLACRSHPSSS